VEGREPLRWRATTLDSRVFAWSPQNTWPNIATDGTWYSVPTGCRDKTAAQTVLNDLQKRAERVQGDLASADAPLFPQAALLQASLLDRDLVAAGVAECDDRGRTVDIHALRHTYGSLLSAGGVAPRTVQAAMRHSSIDLTMNVYTDPRVLDVAAAMDSLPSLPLEASFPQPQLQVATGTEHRNASDSPPPSLQLTGLLTATADNQGKLGSRADNLRSVGESPHGTKKPRKN
jgi:hypothetical protein